MTVSCEANSLIIEGERLSKPYSVLIRNKRSFSEVKGGKVTITDQGLLVRVNENRAVIEL